MGHTLDPPARHPARNTMNGMNGINTRRNHGLDSLRGVGLLIVITAHTGMGELCRGWLVFGIPLFYLVAGYLYRDATSLKEFIAGKFRRLIIPFLFSQRPDWPSMWPATACCCVSRSMPDFSTCCRSTAITSPIRHRYGFSSVYSGVTCFLHWSADLRTPKPLSALRACL